MSEGDLVKPKGIQRLEYRETVEGVMTGLILKKTHENYGIFSTTRYTVLWDNKKVVEHLWMEIEKL